MIRLSSFRHRLDERHREPHFHGTLVVVKVPLAWRILTHDKRRTALALIGIFLAILLVFIELGFYAVPRGGLLLYENMRFYCCWPRKTTHTRPSQEVSRLPSSIARATRPT